MVESILAIVILLLVISLLIYFYLREFKHLGRTDDVINLQVNSFEKQLDRIEKIVNSRDNLLKDIIDKKDAVHLKHIQALEKQMQSKPPAIDKITEYIQSNVPPAPPTPNEIEKTEEQLKDDAFNEAFNKIPITEDTKVAFEGDGLPEEIIS